VKVESDWNDENNQPHSICDNVGEKITKEQLQHAVDTFNKRFADVAFIYEDVDKATGKEECLVIWKVFPETQSNDSASPFLDEYEARKFLNELKNLTEPN
jgi:hypothetical protein